MKKKIQKIIATVLCIAMFLSFAPMSGIAKIDFNALFVSKANALSPTISGVNMNEPREKIATFSYDWANTDYEFTESSILPISFEILTQPDKTEYFVGETLSLSGLTAKVLYNNGSERIISDGFECDTNILSECGMQSITVGIEGASASFNVIVNNIFPTSLEIKKLPSKTIYFTDEEIDFKGLSLSISYNNGSEKNISDLSLVVFSYDFSNIGNNTVEISYEENGIALSNTFNVMVLNKPQIYSNNITAESGDTIAVPVYIKDNCNIMGFKISLNYDPSAFTPVSVTGGDILGVNPDGTQIISILDNNIGLNPDGTFDVIWSSTENMSNNGLLFTAYFTVNNSANGNYDITIDYDPETTFDEDENLVKLDCSGATVSVEYIAFSEPTIKIDSVTAKPSQTISIPIKATSIPETEEFEINVLFDKNIYSSIEVDSPFTDDIRIRNSGVRATFEDIPAITNSTLFTINLTISDSVSGEYQFELDVDFYPGIDNIQLTNGTVSIIPEPTTIWAENISISPNTSYIDVPVFISNNQGLMGFGFDIEFDNSLLKAISVTQGNAITTGSFDYNIQNDSGIINTAWYNSINSIFNGQLFVIRFEVLSNEAATSTIQLSCNQDDTFNENWEDVAVICNSPSLIIACLLKAKEDKTAVVKAGYIYGITQNLTDLDEYVAVPDEYEISYNKGGTYIGTDTRVNVLQNSEIIEEYTALLFGDLDGDGEYNGMDAVILNCILAGMLTENDLDEAVMLAADCNHDGKITSDDFELLAEAGILKNEIDQTHVARNISLDSNGGNCSSTYQTVFLGDSYGELPSAEKEHYQFAGWYTEKDGGEPVDSNTFMNDFTHSTIYSHWNPVSYNITLYSADNAMGSVSGGGATKYGESIVIKAKPKTGYAFLEWSDGNTDLERTIYPEQDSEYTAYFEGVTYPVSLNLDGGICSENSITVKFLENYPDLPIPTKEHYTFDGWYNSKGEPIDSSVKVNTFVPHELHCQWIPDEYSVSVYSSDISTGTVSSGGTVIYGDSIIISACPARGYKFTEWSDGNTEATRTVYPDSDISYTAFFEKDEYTIIFNANGGTVETESITAICNNPIGSMPVPLRDYYTFDGWFTEAEGGEQILYSNSFVRTDALTLYAHWTLNTYMITLNSNGENVSVSTETIQAYCGKEIGVLPTPTRDYYTFTGWYYDNEIVTESSKFYDNVTIYAGWKLNPVSDWVLTSSVPKDAEIVSTKWTYTLREFTTSSSSSTPSGWKYESKTRTSWGAEQTTYNNPSNGERNVWTTNESYISSYTHHWVYYHYANSSMTSFSGSKSNSYPNYYEYDRTSALNASSKYSGRYEYWHSSSNYWLVYYLREYDSPNYSTRTLYHYQEPVYTYRFYKDSSLTTYENDPTGTANVSNVVKFVRYRLK